MKSVIWKRYLFGKKNVKLNRDRLQRDVSRNRSREANMIIISIWLTAALLMLITWGVYLWKGNPGIVDVAWSLAIMVCGIAFLTTAPLRGHQWIFLSLLVIWALRLAFYLFITRIIPGEIDARYSNLSEGWKISRELGFFLNYQLQALLAATVATPFFFIRETPKFWTLTLIPAIAVIIGIVGESVADWQLLSQRRSQRGGICKRGLWRLSRHPNYFFEWVVWLGFASAGITSDYGWVGFISPALLLYIMTQITGPMTERQSLAKHGDVFLHYKKNTSMLFPLPPRK